MAGLDQIIVVCGLGVAVIFVLSHIVTVRFLPAEKALEAIPKVFSFVMGILAVVVLFLSGIGLGSKFLVFIFALCVYSLASFFYILCIFGPYTTSIRLRLIKELDAPGGKTLEEIKQAYNDQTILDIRLKRLLAAGNIRLDKDKYYITNSTNAFFIIDLVAQRLNAFIRSR